MESASYYRDQILANCRWLFGQDVQLITAYEPRLSEVFIVPATSSLQSVSVSNRHKDVLLYVPLDDGDGSPLREMLTKTEELIRGVYTAETLKYEIKTPRVIPGRRNTAVVPQSSEVPLESAIRNLIERIDILLSRTDENNSQGMAITRSLENIAEKIDRTLEKIEKSCEAREIPITATTTTAADKSHASPTVQPTAPQTYHQNLSSSSLSKKPKPKPFGRMSERLPRAPPNSGAFPVSRTASRESSGRPASQLHEDTTSSRPTTIREFFTETDDDTSECETIMTPSVSESGVGIEKDRVSGEIDRRLAEVMIRMAQLLSGDNTDQMEV